MVKKTIHDFLEKFKDKTETRDLSLVNFRKTATRLKGKKPNSTKLMDKGLPKEQEDKFKKLDEF